MKNIPQTEVFTNSIDVESEKHIHELIVSMKANPAKLQQLAIDASHLLSNSDERLNQQRNTGFFKRLVGAFTGKQNELMRQSQSDIIEMQKHAWFYLKELQKQNLINGKSIAIIRNNLVVMNDAIIETRQFLEDAIDKINNRLKKVENKTELQDWVIAKDAEKRKFKKLPQTIKTLFITYDFIKNNYNYIQNYSDMNYIFASLDKLGIDLDETISLNEFIYQLIDEIEVWGGQDKYTNLVKLDLDNHSISHNYIQNNISGASINALYFLDNHYSRIIELLSMSNDETYKEELISKFFGDEFEHLSEIYTIEQLVFEIIGGCLTAIDLYREENNLIDNNSEEVFKEDKDDLNQKKLEAILLLPEIATHTWLQQQDKDTSLKYLKLLSLCCDVNNEHAVLFFEKLVEVANVSTKPQNILDDIVANKNLINNKDFLAEFLQSDNDKYTLIVDMMYMSMLSGINLQNGFIAALVSNTKPNQVREIYSELYCLISNSNQSDIINAIAKLNQFSNAWKNILIYREIEFSSYFNEIIRKLNANNSLSLGFNIASLSFRLMKCMSFGEESWPASKIIESSRDSLLSDLNKEKSNVIQCLENFQSDIFKVNALCQKFGLPSIEFQVYLPSSDYQLESSVKNDSWVDQFSSYQDKLDQALSAIDNSCELATAQLELFSQGKFDVSIIKIKEIEKKEREEKLRLEKLSKLSTTIKVNGSDKKVSIQWKELSGYPFNLNNIRNIVSDGDSWLVLDNNDNLYQSKDAYEWQKVDVPIDSISQIKYIDGIWFATKYNNDFAFSENLSEWYLGQKPQVLENYEYSETDDFMKFGDKWLWRLTTREEYTYTEKGFLWDTDKTGSYRKSIFYITDSLSGQWTRWNNTPRLPDGVVIEKASVIPKSQLVMVFCTFDYSYLSDKKLEEKSNYVIYFNGNDWNKADWNENDIKYISNNLYFKEHLNQYYCYFGGDIFVSEKGYVWSKLLDSNYYLEKSFVCDSVYLFTSSSNKLYFSTDLREYKELILEDGNWEYLTPNNDKFLSIYSKDRHESFLKIGQIIFE